MDGLKCQKDNKNAKLRMEQTFTIADKHCIGCAEQIQCISTYIFFKKNSVDISCVVCGYYH